MSESESSLTGIPKSNLLATARLLLPHLPALVLQSCLHLLSFSPQAQYWDLKATITFTFIRSSLARRRVRSIEEVQAPTLKRTKVQDDTWCAEVSYSPGDGFDGEDVVRAAIVALGTPGVEGSILKVGTEDLTGEWISSRSTPRAADEAVGSPAQAYAALAEDTPEKETAILYLHGGAYCLCDPHTHRSAVVRLCRQSEARAFLPRYRLAPQSPFPGPVVDALISYLYLLYPPPGALHEPIAAEKLVIAGDSAGGGLSLALLQLALQLSRSGGTVRWYGRDVAVPLPGGVVLISPWVDVPRGFGETSGFDAGSEDSCGVYDYLPSARHSTAATYAESPAWNAEIRKQRAATQLYAPDKLLLHPLVSPLLAESWVGGQGQKVPVWLCVGDERLRDQGLYMGHRLHTAGIKLRLEIYTAMPHAFQVIVGHMKVTDASWASMARFFRHVTGAQAAGADYWRVERIHPKTLEAKQMSESELQVGGLEFGKVREMMETVVRGYRELAEEGDGEERDVA